MDWNAKLIEAAERNEGTDAERLEKYDRIIQLSRGIISVRIYSTFFVDFMAMAENYSVTIINEKFLSNEDKVQNFRYLLIIFCLEH